MNRPSYRVVGGGGRGFGLPGGGGPVPRDLIAVMVVLAVTWAVQFLGGNRILELLRLTERVYDGYAWQLVTYPFIGFGGGGFWGGIFFLLVLLMIYWFGPGVFWRLGRRRFWKQMFLATMAGSVVAAGFQLLFSKIGLGAFTCPLPFYLLQGQHSVFVVLIAIYAMLFGEATIHFFGVLPIKARWFLWLEVIFGFLGFTSSRDMPGFFGICAAIFITYATLTPGGPRQVLWRWRKQLERIRLERRLKSMRRERDFNVVDRDDWVH